MSSWYTLVYVVERKRKVSMVQTPAEPEMMLLLLLNDEETEQQKEK